MVVPDSEHPAVARLQSLLRHPTIGESDDDLIDVAAFDDLLDELRRQYPLLHQRTELTRIGQHGLLVHWRGASDQRPVVLMAHLDVVPVDPDSPWTHPPFDGVVADGVIWGRGTLDDKGQVAAIAEAVQRLLEEGFTPAQDVYLSFGANEETGGDNAPLMTEELTRRGVRPWLVLDEGGAIAEDAFPGVAQPVAAIGVTEKGIAQVLLTVEGRGGHASTPAPWGPTTRLARALTRLERSPFPARLPDATVEMLRRLAPHTARPMAPVLSRADLLRPVLARLLVRAGPETAAMARTTMSVTTLSGSAAPNAIASHATAGINLRILPGEDVRSVVTHLRRAIRDDEVAVEVVHFTDPSPVSPFADDEGFALLEATTAAVFPDALVTPYVTMASTDARFVTGISDRVHRFTPFVMSKAQRGSIHSYDESLGVAAFLAGIDWYVALIRGLPAGTAAAAH